MKFKKKLVLLLVLILTLSILLACSNDVLKDKATNNDLEQEYTSTNEENEKVELLVSAAASLTDVMEEIKEAYLIDKPNTEIVFTYAGSGTLQSQIEEGAPVDVFISAAKKQMDALEEKNLIVNDSRKVLLSNKVVLITPKDTLLEINEFNDILNPDIEKIAIGDPTNVPVGQYSEEIFENLAMAEILRPKLIFANDVRAVLTWVETGEVDCGLVYQTDAFTSDKVNIVGQAPQGSHKEVEYPAAVVASSKQADESQKFVDFLSTDIGQELFEKYGFSMK